MVMDLEMQEEPLIAGAMEVEADKVEYMLEMEGSDAGHTKGDEVRRDPRRLVSYKDQLLQINGVWDGIQEDEEDWLAQCKREEVEEEEALKAYEQIGEDDPLNPFYQFDVLEKVEQCKRWRMALIVKLMEKRLGARFLWNRLHKLWNLEGKHKVLDLENDHYMVEFEKSQDYLFVQQQGPWIVADHYLIVQRWRPNLDPFDEKVKKLAVWIRIPGVPREFYTYKDSWRMGNMVGRTLRIDENSLRISGQGQLEEITDRGRFARICVEHGHKKEHCMFNPDNIKKAEEDADVEVNCQNPRHGHSEDTAKEEVERSQEVNGFRNWMTVQKRNNKRPIQQLRSKENSVTKEKSNAGGKEHVPKNIAFGSRFGPLEEGAEDYAPGQKSGESETMINSGKNVVDLNQQKKSKGGRKKKCTTDRGDLNQGLGAEAKASGKQMLNSQPSENKRGAIHKQTNREAILVDRGATRGNTQGEPFVSSKFPKNVIIMGNTNRKEEDIRVRAFPELKENPPDEGSGEEQILALLETRISGNKAERVVRSLGFNSFFIREAVGFSGGIWILWNKSMAKVSIIEEDHQFVHSKIQWLSSGVEEMFTFVYGSPRRAERKNLWDSLKRIAASGGGKWAAMGDFNAYLEEGEKMDGSGLCWENMKEFESCLSESGLSDLGAIVHLHFHGSDHRPIILKDGNKNGNLGGFKPFRFLAAWLTNTSFEYVVDNCWNKEAEWIDAKDKFHNEASIWHNSRFKEEQRRKYLIQKRIKGVDIQLSRGPDEALKRLHRNLWKELNTIYIQEELTWFQRSRCNWLAFGDRNSKFFHASTVSRNRRNKLLALKKDDGIWVEDPEILKLMAIDYFKSLYVEENQITNNLCGNQFPVINNLNWRSIGQTPNVEEIKSTIFKMHPYKAPGADGLHAIFFQSQWERVGSSVIKLVRDVFEDPKKVASVNQTLFCLIPKVEIPKRISQFRPISLCNVVYKVITKVITNRLRNHTGTLIMPNQCSFVKGRHSSDNIRISQEIFTL
ncbi:uncharacterized protein LOC133313564 [Gastrolobium bilobum]|uniref:uncharacterized protein LOC133313564 n=1 Tax=Gastrolobium bilobum TaxID=150636 RepID=UPI002AAF40BC|nr:uncharacterized protein LOC133313564 [Gastrolobium bilobum]